jgi:asparagine synthase (glutamine-hydrolysing)
MCGIAGFITRTPSQFPERALREMTDVIRHRGPDAEGFYRDAHAALGHRRLSIIDLSSGQQPMFNEAGNVCIIFNGEIFNHADIRPELEQHGHVYRTRCDTETILHAYEQYGPECVRMLRGMFAFAIWNSATKTLFAARDRLGIKPLYYYWDGELFAFASEIKALLRHPSLSARFDESVLHEYLALGYTSDERTMFAGIRKLMPGHTLTLTPDTFDIEQYWTVPPQSFEQHDDDWWVKECRRRLEETVRMRLMSDVPLGMFLSGGVDSSAIAALTARMVTERVKTFSVGYSEAPFSELSYAAQVAKTIGTDHHEVVIGRDDFFGALPRLVWHEDEPIVWPSSVSLYFLSRKAAEQVKVVLTGEGADELFGGYERYGHHLLNARLAGPYTQLPESVRGAIRSILDTTTLLNASVRRKLQHTVLGRDPDLQSLYIDNFYSAFSGEEQSRLLKSPPATNAPYASMLEHWKRAGDDRTLLGRLLYTDQKTYLVELLMKQDQMSMAASIESRVPFLDHTYVEFSAGVPDRLKIRGGVQKYILKRAVEDLLPKDIVYRKKMGFPTPLRAWLRDDSARGRLDRLHDPDGLVSHYFDKRGLETLLARHVSGQVDATDRIWRLLNLQAWGQIFLSGRANSQPALYDEDPVGQI